MRKHMWAIAFSACLVAYTAFVSLDTFAFASVYQTNATELNTSLFDGVGYSSDAGDEDAGDKDTEKTRGADASTSTKTYGATTQDAREYVDDDVRISVTEHEVNGTAVYVADVTVSSAESLKTAFAKDSYGRNVTAATSATAAAHDAILAINGDNYGSRERGYVIRNGIVYRDTPDDSDVLCVYADGSFKIVDPSQVSAQELVDQGVWQAFSFGPALVENGSVSVSQNDEVGRAKASNPRTALGVIDDNHFVFVVSDGRTQESEGLSLYELAQFMQQLGVTCAYNLDGGGSSTMVFDGVVVNNPTSNGRTIKERNVNDIVYIG
ncbi:MAG: phosphodiester glycosidase family protein [Atopobiaceae bacterium]|nr:phosphodiester glycosidase family protein [Atopobiaceae bacterium]